MNKHTKSLVLLAVILMCIVEGTNYIWTVFQPYIQEAFNLSIADSSRPFTILMTFFALGNLLGGAFQNKIGIRTTILLGSIFICVGFALCALATISTTWLLSLGFGICVGFGSGYAFNSMILAAQLWYPNQKGLITGVTVASVGVSCAILNPICDYLLSFTGYRTAFWMVTIFCVIFSLSVFLIPSDTDKLAKTNLQDADCAAETSSSEANTGILAHIAAMFHLPKFIAVTIALAIIVSSYYLLNPLVKSLGISRDLSNATALSCVVIFSVANIIGRFAIPWISDHISHKTIVRALFAVSILSMFGLVLAEGFLYITLAAFISIVYGGVMGVFPILVGEYFGVEDQSFNLGIVMLGTIVTSFLCPMILGMFGIEISFAIAGGLCVIGLWLTKMF